MRKWTGLDTFNLALSVLALAVSIFALLVNLVNQ